MNDGGPSRSRRVPILMAGVVAVIVVGALLMLPGKADDAAGPPPAPAAGTSSAFARALPTTDGTELSGMEARTTGTLRLSGEGCVVLVRDEIPEPTKVVWPRGYRLDDSAGMILDADGKEIAPLDVPIAMAGGSVRFDRDAGPCVIRGDEVWVAGPVETPAAPRL